MKYSFRSLLLVVTVVAVLTGLWVQNWRTCRRREHEHAELASQLEAKAHKKILLAASIYSGSPLPRYGSTQEDQQARDHRILEADYRQAKWQPWKRWWIDESRHVAKANGN